MPLFLIRSIRLIHHRQLWSDLRHSRWAETFLGTRAKGVHLWVWGPPSCPTRVCLMAIQDASRMLHASVDIRRHDAQG